MIDVSIPGSDLGLISDCVWILEAPSCSCPLHWVVARPDFEISASFWWQGWLVTDSVNARFSWFSFQAHCSTMNCWFASACASQFWRGYLIPFKTHEFRCHPYFLLFFAVKKCLCSNIQCGAFVAAKTDTFKSLVQGLAVNQFVMSLTGLSVLFEISKIERCLENWLCRAYQRTHHNNVYSGIYRGNADFLSFIQQIYLREGKGGEIVGIYL